MGKPGQGGYAAGNNPNNYSQPAGPNAGNYSIPGGQPQPTQTAAPTMAAAAPSSPAMGMNPNAFLPPVFQQPYAAGIQNATGASNWSSQAIPNAAGFQQALYGPGMTPMEQTMLSASGSLGQRALIDTQNRIAGMFENNSSHGSLAPAMLNAANQFGEQMNQMAGQMGTQRQGLAAQAMPFTFGFPIQAAQAAQGMADNFYGMANNAMYGDLQFPLAMHGSTSLSAPTVIAQPSGGGKGKG